MITTTLKKSDSEKGFSTLAILLLLGAVSVFTMHTMSRMKPSLEANKSVDKAVTKGSDPRKIKLKRKCSHLLAQRNKKLKATKDLSSIEKLPVECEVYATKQGFYEVTAKCKSCTRSKKATGYQFCFLGGSKGKDDNVFPKVRTSYSYDKIDWFCSVEKAGNNDWRIVASRYRQNTKKVVDQNSYGEITCSMQCY